jgi:adenylylsulfate kinase-like enzyme
MVIVITGPIASGKSTIARELARELERMNVRTAVIDLDVVHDRLAPDGSKSHDAMWSLARRAAATQTNTFLEEGVTVVIAEGSFNRPVDRAAFAEHLQPHAEPLYVTLRVSFDEALRRAERDPTRGVSRDRAFLGSSFAASADALTTTPATDLVIDTEQMTATAAATAIARVLPRS